MRNPLRRRYYFGQLQRIILDAHKDNPEARPSQLVDILKRQGHTPTAKYVSKTIRAARTARRWINGRIQQTEAATVKFRRGPAPKGTAQHDNHKKPAKTKRRPPAKKKPAAKPNARPGRRRPG